jgi:DNA-binding NarL/FixJ family response regulator
MRVVIAEDFTLLREGLARLLTEAEFDVVACGGDADALLAATARHRPDVAVIDIRMPPTQVTLPPRPTPTTSSGAPSRSRSRTA